MFLCLKNDVLLSETLLSPEEKVVVVDGVKETLGRLLGGDAECLLYLFRQEIKVVTPTNADGGEKHTLKQFRLTLR